jgi:hypothetical protein
MAFSTSASSSSSTTSDGNSAAPTTLHSLHHYIQVKLSRENYPIWHTQIVPYLEGNELYEFVNGESICPPKFINSVATESTPSVLVKNPEYSTWYHQDKIVLSALISTLSVDVLPHVVGIKTSRAVWLLLEKMFASEAKARVMQTKLLLTTMKKGSLSVADYFMQAQRWSNLLAAVENPVKDADLVCYIIGGLSADYDPLVASLTTRLEPISLEDLYAHLLIFEQRLERNNSVSDLTNSSVHVAQRQIPMHGRGGRASNGPSNGSFHGRGRGRGRGGRALSSHQFGSSNRPMCQLCNKVGHTAARCYHRFDHAYQVSSPPAAFLTVNQPSPDINWYPDTASTHHLTNDLTNLNITADEYTGNEQIRVGNGQGLKILHTGSAFLPSTHKHFSLKSLLHVPVIQKNLISVNKFTRDNNVFIEFHPFDFRVKDLHTHRLLLRGPSRDGLYIWPSPLTLPPSSSPSACLGERVSVDSWHRRLGHPALRIVRNVLSKHCLPVSSNKPSQVCPACQQGKMHRLHFGSSPSVSVAPLSLLFLDVWGPAPILSKNNKRYYLCIVDDFSRYSWLFPLSAKSDVFSTFVTFRTLVENFFNLPIKSVQSDGGGEFIPLRRYFNSVGINYRQTCPHTHHQNGSVERKHRHIVDTGLAILSHSKVPFQFWDEAF